MNEVQWQGVCAKAFPDIEHRAWFDTTESLALVEIQKPDGTNYRRVTEVSQLASVSEEDLARQLSEAHARQLNHDAEKALRQSLGQEKP